MKIPRSVRQEPLLDPEDFTEEPGEPVIETTLVGSEVADIDAGLDPRDEIERMAESDWGPRKPRED